MVKLRKLTSKFTWTEELEDLNVEEIGIYLDQRYKNYPNVYIPGKKKILLGTL